MKLTSSNYHSAESNIAYWSVSQFKAFDRCEAAALAAVQGLTEKEDSDALLFGSYVDAYFSGELDEFIKRDGDKMHQRNGNLYAKFAHVKKVIDRVEADPLMMEFLKGDKQIIRTAELFGVPWKIKMDVYYPHEWVDKGVIQPGRIVDLKTVKDFAPMYKEGFGRVSWIEYWGYDIQGAIYQKIEQISSQRDRVLPFYIVAVTKEKVPDIAVIQIPQHILDAALKVVEAKIDEFDLVKSGEMDAKRCEHCEWCKQTKVLTEPIIFESLEA